MSEVAQWLDGLGLGQYSEAFRDNDIDAANLQHLTADDLREIGISSVGHRRTLLAAITKLRNPDAQDSNVGQGVNTTSPSIGGDAGRRQLTVMFCDLVGSTALSERLDPEDLRHVITSFQKACHEAINLYEGYIARFMGDGILVYFGYPKAHENDPERAVRAGLRIIEMVDELAPVDDVPLTVRLGIATGEVVVGDIIGEGVSEEHAVLGDTPNLAARLQGKAEPGTVLISNATRQLVDGLFDMVDIGAQDLKGISTPVNAWRVEAESIVSTRFEAAVGRGLTPMAGREEEVGMLLNRWRQAADGEGQVLILTGEPGIGKSRVLRAFRDRVQDTNLSRVFQFCSPFHRNSALYPSIRQFERAARIEKSDSDEQRLEKIEQVLDLLDLAKEKHYPTIAALLGLASDKFGPVEVNPAKLRTLTFATVIALLEAMSQQDPVLMVVEDVHWIDPTTMEMLGILIGQLSASRIFLIITARPEFEPPWRGHTHLTSLSLNRLGRQDCLKMIDRLAGGKTLPMEVLDYIVSKTDGVPLFVEELTKSMLELELLYFDETTGAYALKGPLEMPGIPASLQDSLMARLDTIPLARELAQRAAVIGRTFAFDLLHTISGLENRDLDERLDLLIEAGLIHRRSGTYQLEYEFKHALVQDTAYEALLKNNRQAIHLDIAEALENEFPEIAEAEPQVLAHHYAKAKQPEKAFEYWRLAGEKALARSANIEALAHLGRALTLIEEIPESTDRHSSESKLQIAYGVASMSSKGFAAPEVESAYLRARELAQLSGDNSDLFTATWGLWIFDQVTTRYQGAQELSDELLALADQQEDAGIELQAHHAAWTTQFVLGDLSSTLKHTSAGTQLYDVEEHCLHAYHYGGHDPGACGLSFQAITIWLAGWPDQARDDAIKAIKLSDELAQPFSRTEAVSFAPTQHCVGYKGIWPIISGDPEVAIVLNLNPFRVAGHPV
ncbi:MAG: AAA family ATPase [Gammaproteobacteria bacterium]|nr:AAA family ATPase [Gammaproteobacteria bacterium]